MALKTRLWTRADLDRLPDDGNKYEVIDGELLVTPPPSDAHEDIAAWLNAVLGPFVTAHKLGLIYRPRSVVVTGGSQVEPDLMVRQLGPPGWENKPLPILVVEVLSRSTATNDLKKKRAFYPTAGIPEYWVVDRFLKRVILVRPGLPDEICTGSLTWAPPGIDSTLHIDLSAMFLLSP